MADFGIALAVQQAGGTRLTETGLSIGSPYYMSPEQATGDRELMPASDVYALACVLYEMLVGEPPYMGSTAQAILARIIAGEITRPTETRPSIPANVESAILKALERLPADRFASAAAFGAALSDPGFRHGLLVVAEGPSKGPAWLRFAPWVLAAAATAIALISVASVGPQGSSRYWGMALPDSAVIPLRPLAPLGSPRNALAVSPNGELIVHMGFDGVETRLYRRSLVDNFEHLPIRGTEGAHYPFFSPDGEWIAYFAGTQLWRVSLRGGDPEPIVEAPNAAGGFWTESDEIVFSSDEGRCLATVSASGGEARDLTPLELTGVGGFDYPEPLPGGDAIVFLGRWPATIMAMRLSDGIPKELTQGTSPKYVSTGHLVFARGNTIYAALFDPDAFELLSDPVPVLEGVRTESGVAQYEVSEDGTLYFVPGPNADTGFLSWADTLGTVDTLRFPPAQYQKTMVSPNGLLLASLVYGGSEHILILNLETGGEEEIIESVGLTAPMWMPDGSGIVYTRPEPGGVESTVLVQRALGSSEEHVLHEADSPIAVSSVSPNGELVFFQTFTAGAAGDLWMVDTLSQAEIYLDTDANEWGAVLEPEGDWVAYTSDFSGQYQVYVEPFPRTGASREKVSVHDNAEEPLWSSDGSEIYYRSNNSWWAVPIETEPELTVGQPRLIFEGAYLNVGERSYDLHPDGRRFLVIDVPSEPSADRIHVITHWVDEVARVVSGATAAGS